MGILILATQLVFAKGFFEDRERGWFWYEEAPEEVEKKPQKTVQVRTQPKSAKEILEAQKKRLDMALSSAIVSPTKRNIKRYMHEVKLMNDQAHNFADKYQEVLWESPKYDYTVKNPVSPEAIIAKNSEERALRTKIIRDLSKEHGLIFYFSADCPYCHQFAPVVKLLEKKFSFSVTPLSKDHRGIPAYPSPKHIPGVESTLNVRQYPAVYLASTATGSITPVSFGSITLDELEKRIVVAARRLHARN